MSELREHIVTCRSMADLDSLYDDMETPGGNLYIPDRAVDLVHRRAISRNTHYMLTDEEAAQVAGDPRVLACELSPDYLPIEDNLYWNQTGNFSKATLPSSNVASSNKNWALLRCTEGSQRSGWSDSSSATQSNETIFTTSSGRNVDVVIVDDHIIANDHPEFMSNPDGTGTNRLNQIDWFQYSATLGYTTPETYDYSNGGTNQYHGTHVAGTACGNTQGWARNANIYNLRFSYDATEFSTSAWNNGMLWDYLRHWHQNKPINPETGRRNPTITNHSWGSNYGGMFLSDISALNFRGTSIDLSSLTNAQKETQLQNTLMCPDSQVQTWNPSFEAIFNIPFRSASRDADVEDTIADGILVVAAASNDRWWCDNPGGLDYDNNFTHDSFGTIYVHRGSSPGAASGAICVGNIGTKSQEYKAESSNFGPRVDIYAPGTNIISCVNDGHTTWPYANDPRDSDFRIASLNGTSMASPQVCGVLACLLEQEPNLTQAEALQYLIETSTKDQIGDTGTGFPPIDDYEAFSDDTIGESKNRYLFVKKKRPGSGPLTNTTYKNRNPDTGGVKYPRTRNSITKRKA